MNFSKILGTITVIFLLIGFWLLLEGIKKVDLN